MYADDHQMYVMGKKHDVVAQSIKIHGGQALSWYISQPTQKRFGYLQSTQEMLTQTMIIKIYP